MIRGTVKLQLATRMRPGEVCILRLANIDMTGEVWRYSPMKHKTQHRGKTRIVYMGLKAQAVLRPYMQNSPSAYCFSPQSAEVEHHNQQ